MEESSGIFIPMVSGPGEKSGSEVCWEAHLTGCLRTPACNRAILRRAAAATCGDHLPVCLEPRPMGLHWAPLSGWQLWGSCGSVCSVLPTRVPWDIQ